MAGVQGFEPRYYGPEPHVLPLDDTPAWVAEYNYCLFRGQEKRRAFARRFEKKRIRFSDGG